MFVFMTYICIHPRSPVKLNILMVRRLLFRPAYPLTGTNKMSPVVDGTAQHTAQHNTTLTCFHTYLLARPKDGNFFDAMERLTGKNTSERMSLDLKETKFDWLHSFLSSQLPHAHISMSRLPCRPAEFSKIKPKKVSIAAAAHSHQYQLPAMPTSRVHKVVQPSELVLGVQPWA